MNPNLFGYNLEVFGTMVNNTMDDTAGLAIADALHLGTLRYPGGTMANIWDPRAGRYTGIEKAAYAKFAPYAELIKAAGPPGTFGAAKFLQGVGGRANATIWDLNVYSFNTSQACAQIEYIASLPPPPDGVHLLELGNELYSHSQGGPKFETGASYAEQMKPIIACARRILPHAKIALVGFSGPSPGAWSESILNVTRHDSALDFDALTLHTYLPHDAEVAAVAEADRLSYVAGYSRQLLRHCVNISVGMFGARKQIWHTEFNYGLEKDIFFPDLVFGALHGVFHASRILAAVELHDQIGALTFQTFVHPHPYPAQDSAFHPAMPVARIHTSSPPIQPIRILRTSDMISQALLKEWDLPYIMSCFWIISDPGCGCVFFGWGRDLAAAQSPRPGADLRHRAAGLPPSVPRPPS